MAGDKIIQRKFDRLERKMDLMLRLLGVALADLGRLADDEINEQELLALTHQLQVSKESLVSAIQANTPKSQPKGT